MQQMQQTGGMEAMMRNMMGGGGPGGGADGEMPNMEEMQSKPLEYVSFVYTHDILGMMAQMGGLGGGGIGNMFSKMMGAMGNR